MSETAIRMELEEPDPAPLCAECGKEPVQDGDLWCAACAEVNRTCRCGTLALPGDTVCRECRDAMEEDAMDARAEARREQREWED